MPAPPRPPKQEQEPASSEITEVAPGVLRLQLQIDFTGLGHVNMYALVDDEGVALVDPGLPGPGTWSQILTRLEAADLRLDQVHTVIVTHSHPDHFGGAGRIAEEAGARLVAHAGFRVPWLVETWPDVIELDDDGFPLGVPEPDGSTHGGHVHTGGEPPLTWQGATTWDPAKSFMPPAAEVERIRSEREAQPESYVAPVPTHRLADGDSIGLAGRDWFGVHTPGHTEDHLCLHDPTHGVLLTGDHVLPSITPHISGMGSTDVHDPLDAFLEALDRVASLDVGIALPAHGHPFDDVAGRAAAIAEHHEQRLHRLFAIAESLDGAGTVADFSEQLFPPRHWGLMAESETYAHLEHLRHTGRARRRSHDGLLRYEIVEATAPDAAERADHRARRTAAVRSFGKTK
jgi:glyoxylase-like metal-dependent hydrolase (beta-lactamase superfamily II)